MRPHSALRSAFTTLVLTSVAVGCGIGDGGTEQVRTPGSSTSDATASSSSDSGSSLATEGGTGATDSTTTSSADASGNGSAPDGAGDSAAEGDDGGEQGVEAGPDAGSDAAVEVTADAGADAAPDAGAGMTVEAGVEAGVDAAPDTGGGAVVDSGPVVDSGAVCSNSATRCVGNSLETCSAGQWGAAEPCVDQTCITDKCTGECAPAQLQCDGLQPQSCTAGGAWQDTGAPCAVSCTGAGVCTAPMCGLGNGGATQCAAGDSCCYNSTAFTESCEATCSSSTSAMDCMGNTGANECGSGTVCCATIVLVGGVVGSCDVSSLSSSCQTTCAENLPGTTCGSARDPLTFTLRLCSSANDCADDSTGTLCCEYNDVPIYWCVPDKTLTTGCK
jgi:hypothetical protein